MLSLPHQPVTFDTPLLLDNHILRVHAHALRSKSRRVGSKRVGPECLNPSLKGKTSVSCRWCGHKASPGLFGLRLHERKAHPEHFTFTCLFFDCQSTFADENHVLTCQATHKDSLPTYKCFVCQIPCTSGSELKEHLAYKHTSGGIKCDACPEVPLSSTKRYPNTAALRIHKGFHHGEEFSHKCPICQKGFMSPFYLKDHLRYAHKDSKDPIIPDPYKCSDCGQHFSTNTQLYRHNQAEHWGQGNIMCEVCGKIIRTRTAMYTHMKNHKGIKNNICQFCGKTYIHLTQLNVHLRSHTGEKPFKCSICGKSFSTSTVLKKHIPIHDKQKPQECYICSKSFSNQTSINRHFAMHKRKGTWIEKPSPMT